MSDFVSLAASCVLSDLHGGRSAPICPIATENGGIVSLRAKNLPLDNYMTWVGRLLIASYSSWSLCSQCIADAHSRRNFFTSLIRYYQNSPTGANQRFNQARKGLKDRKNRFGDLTPLFLC